ncbi:hypothetical protein [Haloarchaeobius sp. HME9146]|uniref:hypothetical protein n=1 Tax=Haloarchaeobius sp. HME9146 TaxID=2978732 RepID=UPI0021BE0105|nr:hypothetical protein [Haloarchaeobius sp. HME9146]MCT9097979.1 hypothetical protein [Haloarchaeobius sp. HME9146]
MNRRALLATVVSLGTVSAGCLASDDCRGVALAVELRPATDVDSSRMLNFDSKPLSERERAVLRQAVNERVMGCSRDDVEGLQDVADRIVAHTGREEAFLETLEGRASTPAVFEEAVYRANVIWDSAEAAGGPLGA